MVVVVDIEVMAARLGIPVGGLRQRNTGGGTGFRDHVGNLTLGV